MIDHAPLSLVQLVNLGHVRRLIFILYHLSIVGCLCSLYFHFLLANQDTRAEGRGRVARHQRRLLLVEVERRIVQYQIYVDEGLVKLTYPLYSST